MAKTYTWTGNADGSSWDLARNWSPSSAYPGESGTTDIVVINETSAATINFDVATATIGSLTLEGAGDPILALGANTLNVDGAVYIGAGGLTLAGGVLNAAGQNIKVQPGAALTGYGTVDAKEITYGGSGAGTVEASGGVLNLDLSGSTGTNYGLHLAINSALGGTLNINGSSTTTVHASTGISLTNADQTLEISGGTLALGGLNAAVNGGATVELAAGATLQEATGMVLGANSALTGAGVVDVGAAGGGKYFSGDGTVTATGELTFSHAVDPNGTTATAFDIANNGDSDLVFKGAVGTTSVDPSVTFAGTYSGTGVLDLSGAGDNAFHGVIDNFNAGDKIITPVQSGFLGNNEVSVSLINPDVVTVKSDGTTVDTLTFGNSTEAGDVFVSSGGVLETTYCFMAGTMIRTPDGEAAIETLKHGDLVVTADGAVKPVAWLGRQTISTVFADPLRVTPIRVKAGALGENTPSRDLLVSPDHALLIDGALIQAGALVNDTSIMRETSVPKVFTYYHVELDDHLLILAENAPAETFVDNVERLAFDNWAEYEALYPEGKSVEELPYPRAKSRRQVPVYIRVQIAERAQIIGAVADGAAVA